MPTIKQRKIRPRVKVIAGYTRAGSTLLEAAVNKFLDFLVDEGHWGNGVNMHTLSDSGVIIEWIETTGFKLVDSVTGEEIANETPSGIVTAGGLKLVKP